MIKKQLITDEEWARLAAVTPEEKEKALKKLRPLDYLRNRSSRI